MAYVAENTELFKSKLQKFIAKRAAVFVFLSVAADMALLGSRKWLVLAGFLAGSLVSFGRLCGNEWIFGKIFQLKGARAAAGSIVAFTLSQIVLLLAIVLAYMISIWVLYGLVGGLLVIPAVIMVNSITEAIGVTKNNFE